MTSPRHPRAGGDPGLPAEGGRAAPPVLLDPLGFVLRGSSLIEASAGTGKTFTIAALYLRLVLGHGDDAAFARPLTPPEILVVTFTDAATQELRDRIRARLSAAADAFLRDPQDDEAAAALDPLLGELRTAYPAAAWPGCAQRLRLAAEWMDEAAVSTIHGWCHRMLREHAFDSGSLFDQALEADQAELLQEAVRDYWRTFFYPLPAQDAQCVGGWWRDPDALRRALQPLLAQAGDLPAAPEPAGALAEARLAREQQLAELRSPWNAWCEELQQLLDDAVAAGQVNGTRLKKVHYDGWLQQLRLWCRGGVDAPQLTDAAWSRLTREGLREAWKKPHEAPDHPALQEIETLAQRLACLPECRDAVLAHAARWVAGRVDAEQRRRAEMGFDDLLTRLHAALQRPDSGARLAALIRTQFPVALIDEFQDTDPVQYGIFHAIYHPQEPQQDTALVLIGDPKQAIYAFRGADIFTYLAAKRDTAGRHATLGTNFRSTRAMVQAVNRVFLQAEERPEGEGAFLFRAADGDTLPFFPVQAQGRRQHWEVDGAEPSALTCWWDDDGAVAGAADYRRRMAGACAAEIVRLLRLAQDGRAGFRDPDGVLQPLRPRDIAVLVNDGQEARAVREALRARGVHSVYLSDRDSVFRSAAAAELQRLLQACAAPEDGTLVRAALATPLLAQDWVALDRLNHDEIHWEERLEQFRRYRECWQRQGVLPMLRRLLHDFGVPERLIAARDERLLTDLLHLAELLQQASVLIDGEHALVRHLVEQREEATQAVDNRQLRLESDADLLKVVTVHKSKGLEYPLVFLPFPCACRPVKPEDVPIKWHDEAGRPRLSLQADPAVVDRADRERLGEDLRKLYVALTRARFATWIGVAPTAGFERSALGYLLAAGESVPAGGLEALLTATLGGSGAIAVARAPEPGEENYVAEAAVSTLAPPPPLPAAPPQRWWIASYSRIRKTAGAPVRGARPRDGGGRNLAGDGAGTAARGGRPRAAARHAARLPARAHARQLPARAAGVDRSQGLRRRRGRAGRDRRTAGAPLPAGALGAASPGPARLARALAGHAAGPAPAGAGGGAGRPAARCARRRPRWSSGSPRPTSTRRYSTTWCAATRWTGWRARGLEPERLNGMLKGFMDLVFEHEGRYYVADYKSNWLGPDDAAYGVQAMRDEVLHHRYELQYCLYLFALHRLLRSRLPDYDYDRHVGGAVYVFLRGCGAPSQGLHLERPPAALMAALDRLFSAEAAA